MSELSREQVEQAFDAVYWRADQQGEKQGAVLDGVDALRATITQQAQELDESERKLVGLCHAHGTALIEIHDLKKELEQAKGNYAIQKAAADDYEQQLAASQARCREMENSSI